MSMLSAKLPGDPFQGYGATSSDFPGLKDGTGILLSALALIIINVVRQHEIGIRGIAFKQEVFADWLSWLIVLVGCKLARRNSPPHFLSIVSKTFWNSTTGTWLVSSAFVASRLLTSRRTMFSIFPLTTIVVSCGAYFMHRNQARVNHVDTEKSKIETSYHDQSHSKPAAVERLQIVTILSLGIVCFALVSTSNASTAVSSSGCLLAAATILVRTVALLGIANISRPCQDASDAGFTPGVQNILSSLAMPSFSILTGAMVLTQPDLRSINLSIILHAATQTLWILATTVLVRCKLVNTAANLETLALTMEMSWMSSDLTGSIVGMSAYLTSLLQSVLVIRTGAPFRKMIFLAILSFFIALCVHQSPDTSILNASLFTTAPTREPGHPIEQIIQEKRNYFAQKLTTQSKTLSEAVTEYKRRYHRAPPKGFDAWYQIARDNNFVLIDEFDTFMQSIEPFHGIHPSILQHRLHKLIQDPEYAWKLCVIEFKNHTASYHSPRNITGDMLLNPEWFHAIPYDMTVALNFFDEPIVSSSWDNIAKAMHMSRHVSGTMHNRTMQLEDPTFLNLARQSGWGATKSACPVESPSRADMCHARNVGSPLEFIHNTTHCMDVCEHCELPNQHGLLMSPDTLRITTDLVPVWSASKPSHFNDIMYPSAYYIEYRGAYSPKLDRPWHEKDNRFYWVGSATGGYATEHNWFKFQRQRLVLQTKPTSNEPIQMLAEESPGSNKWVPRFSTMAELSGLFVTKMARIVQANKAALSIQEQVFDTQQGGNIDRLDEAYAHKFVFDIDGNGFSGRFYRLLKSRSVVVKSTILKEWHDDRLIPWVHYVPLSIGYQELPEVARFLATTQRGLELSERIALESSQWHDLALRDVDLRISWLRMLLEYGRLFDRDMVFTM